MTLKDHPAIAVSKAKCAADLEYANAVQEWRRAKARLREATQAKDRADKDFFSYNRWAVYTEKGK